MVAVNLPRLRFQKREESILREGEESECEILIGEEIINQS